ncbi:DUF4192 domain-containing protein [Pseudonocardia xishanensis]|uniref:Uncharacterized protein n=1 Tax=Pseudonocardia xishanensis TaxID=630995 RepID=A0ABP8RVN0_9PSEU
MSETTTRPAAGYGHCTGCDQLKSLDHRGHPYPHNRFTAEATSLRTRRCTGEHTRPERSLTMTNPYQSARPPAPGQPVRLTSGDGIIASIPTLVGFTRTESLVIITLAGRRVGLTLRVDLPPTGAQTTGLATHAARVIDQHQRDDRLTAVLVIIGATVRDDLVDAVTEHLSTVGVGVQQAVHTPAIAAGMPWKCLCDCGNAGILDDPAISVVAVTAAAPTGRVGYRSRAELAAELDSRIDTATARRRAEQISALDGDSAPVQAAILKFGSRVLSGRLDEVDEDIIVGSVPRCSPPPAAMRWSRGRPRSPSAV